MVKLYASLVPRFWQVSHGNDCINDVEVITFEKRCVVVVNQDTPAMAKSSIS